MNTVTKLSFRTAKPQTYYDSWRDKARTCLYHGTCWACERRTYAFTDGENDPRGVLGDHAASPLSADDYGMSGPDVPLCFPCANEEPSYNAALLHAKRSVWQAQEPAP